MIYIFTLFTCWRLTLPAGFHKILLRLARGLRGDGDSNMPAGDFMAMRRKVVAEEQLLAGRRRAEALTRARDVAVWLKKEYHVDAVYLYGSLAWGGFHSRSDIDLLVRGFRDKEHYWQMQARAEEIAGHFDLNLVCEEDVPDSLRQKVSARGVKLV